MDALKVTFVNGESMVFAFGPDSTLSVETPDGVNGVQRGVVSEVVDVEYVKDAPAAEAAVAEPAPVAEEPVAADASAEISQVDESEQPVSSGEVAEEPDAIEPATTDAPASGDENDAASTAPADEPEA